MRSDSIVDALPDISARAAATRSKHAPEYMSSSSEGLFSLDWVYVSIPNGSASPVDGDTYDFRTFS